MRKNKLKQIWKDGGYALNGWLHIPSTWSTELMAHAGWDSLTIDMQHGMMGLETTIQMLQAISITDTVPLVRVNWNEPGSIMRVLDAGAYGVICPMVNTREECEAFVGAARFHPDGYRSLGPTRAKVYAGADYGEHANDEIITMAMIETKQAVDNVEEIASVPGLDAFYIGPGDLRLTLLGGGGMDNQDAEFYEAIDTILAAAKKHNIVVGIHTATPEYARSMIERGMQFVTILTDGSLLQKAANEAIGQIRGEVVEGTKRKDAY